MEQITILSNIGSASKKYSVYQAQLEIAWFHYEKIGEEFLCSYKVRNGFEKKHSTKDSYNASIVDVFETLKNLKVIESKTAVELIALRVVIPYSDFVFDIKCTPSILKKLKHLKEIDPLHIAPVIAEIDLINEFFGIKIPICLISDSSFHISSKKRIPLNFKEPLYTIGYHGLSCESVLSVLKQRGIEHSKLIVAHLGGGSSVSAINKGISMYNSMEVSPINGVLMSTRSGSIDPFVVLLYMKEYGLSYKEVLEHLYTNSGLKVLSGVSGDLRVIREEVFKGNKDAKYAIGQFVDSIASNICKATAYTQGVDTLVFTGTIGLRASYIRELVLEKLIWLGCIVDHYKNTDASDVCFEISAHNSKIKIFVIQIDEMKEMHMHTKRFL